MSTGAKTGEGHVAALDGWRGLAILSVLIGHFLLPPIHLGLFGVELFFVLSGRLMAGILFVKNFPLGEFFYRRASRIIPALFVFVIVTWVAVRLVNVPEFQMSPLWIGAALTFTLNYAMVFRAETIWFDHIWSLCVEEHAYMLLGLLALVFGRGRNVLAVVWIVALFAMLSGLYQITVLKQEYFQTYWRSDVHIASIFISVAAFLTLRRWHDRRWLRAAATPAFILCLSIGLAVFQETTPIALMHTAGTLCLAIAVALVEVVAEPLRRALSFAPLRWLGLCSYSLYLWQQPFYKLRLLENGAPIPLLLAATFACAIASYFLVEKPARRTLNAAWARWNKQVPEAASATPDASKPAI